MRRALRMAAAGVAAGLASAAWAQDDALTRQAVQGAELPQKQAPVALYYSPSSEAAADRFAATLAEAVAWYRDQLGWQGRFVMAVLDAGDYARFAGQPYPVPYAEVATGLVVMPNSIADFPGFDAWGLDAIDLNADLTTHEVGHAIAWNIGLWSSSYWVNEFVADIFLAAYLRATRPGDRRLLEGAPPAFANAARTTRLTDLDDLYAGVGLDNYAWFQFRLAALADYLVADTDFPTVIAELQAAFPRTDDAAGGVMPTPEGALRRLEKIKPGIAARAADMLGRPDLPTVEPTACGPDGEAGERPGVIVVENAGPDTLRLSTRAGATLSLRTENVGNAMSDAELARRVDEALASGEHGTAIPPAHRTVFREYPAGTQVYIAGGGCLVVPDGVAAFVRSGS